MPLLCPEGQILIFFKTARCDNSGTMFLLHNPSSCQVGFIGVNSTIYTAEGVNSCQNIGVDILKWHYKWKTYNDSYNFGSVINSFFTQYNIFTFTGRINF